MDELTELCIKHLSDKFGSHTYTPIYSQYFEPIRNEKLRLLEIGYGGYGDPNQGGESARLWAEYFPNSEIVVTDIYPKNIAKNERFVFKQGNQTDEIFMKSLGKFDIIIDDGSHVSDDIIKTFEFMFFQLNMGGIYIIEDTQTAYWQNFSHPYRRTTDYFKVLTDGLNYNEIKSTGYMPTYLDRFIFAIHFYHNLIIIFKGDNTEPSNVVKNQYFSE
jgi:hypothetical protein